MVLNKYLLNKWMNYLYERPEKGVGPAIQRASSLKPWLPNTEQLSPLPPATPPQPVLSRTGASRSHLGSSRAMKMEKPTMKTFRPESMSARWNLENPVDRTTAWVTPSTPPISGKSSEELREGWQSREYCRVGQIVTERDDQKAGF